MMWKQNELDVLGGQRERPLTKLRKTQRKLKMRRDANAGGDRRKSSRLAVKRRRKLDAP
jgi:hypothetical protein